MKTLTWDRMLSILGLLFSVVPWLLPDASLEEKVAVTVTLIWMSITLQLISSRRLFTAWFLISVGLVTVSTILGYSRLLSIQPRHLGREIMFGLLAVLVIGIIAYAARKSMSSHMALHLAPLHASEQFDAFSKEAEEVCLYGLTLAGLRNHHSSTIEHLVKSKECRLRAILPCEEIILSYAYRMSLDYKQQVMLNEEYQAVLAWLERLAKQYADKVQIRTTTVLPTLSILIVNPNSHRAKLRVSLHVYRGALNKRPYFEMSRHEQPEWYSFFARMYDDLWDQSTPWSVGSKEQLRRSQERLQKLKGTA